MTGINFGVHGNGKYEGGLYNVLSSFNIGVYKALKSLNLNTKLVSEYIEENTVPHISIGFNVFGHSYWKSILESSGINVMWSVDSPFFHNFNVIDTYCKYPKFILACVSPVDKNVIEYFLPDTKFLYVPHGIDPELWYPNDTEKDFEIIFMSSLNDPKKEIQKVKDVSTPENFEIFMNMYDYAMSNPETPFPDVYAYFSDIYGFNNSNPNTYYALFRSLCYTVTYSRRIQLIKSLKDFNVKIWGSDHWEKYVEGKVEYMGYIDLLESVDVVRRAKIVLHLQPMQILNGLHERILSATATKSFVVSDHNPAVVEHFGNSIAYYGSNFEGISDSINQYLSNDSEREANSNIAMKLTLQNHTWRNRVVYLLEQLGIRPDNAIF